MSFPYHALGRRGARNEPGARGRRSPCAERAGEARRAGARRAGDGRRPARAAQPPSKVDLVSPEPQWAKLCGKEHNTGKDACHTMRDFGPRPISRR